MRGSTQKDWGEAFRSGPSIEQLREFREEDFGALIEAALKYRQEQERDDAAHGARLRKCRDAVEQAVKLYVESTDDLRRARRRVSGAPLIDDQRSARLTLGPSVSGEIWARLGIFCRYCHFCPASMTPVKIAHELGAKFANVCVPLPIRYRLAVHSEFQAFSII